MLLQILVAVVCLFAGALQFAAVRSPDVCDASITRTARKITGASLLCLSSYILYAVAEFGYAQPVLCLFGGLFSLGQILFAMHTFFDPSCTERLMAPRMKGKSSNETSHA